MYFSITARQVNGKRVELQFKVEAARLSFATSRRKVNYKQFLQPAAREERHATTARKRSER